jgi:hypothetical protein
MRVHTWGRQLNKMYNGEVSYNIVRVIPVAGRSKVWVRSRSLAGTAGSNPVGRMKDCLL